MYGRCLYGHALAKDLERKMNSVAAIDSKRYACAFVHAKTAFRRHTDGRYTFARDTYSVKDEAKIYE